MAIDGRSDGWDQWFGLEKWGDENHRKMVGKPWENGGLMGFNGI